MKLHNEKCCNFGPTAATVRLTKSRFKFVLEIGKKASKHS
jgi:hypothetical protein